MPEYTKYCYWVNPPILGRLKADLHGKEMLITDESQIPCRVLRTSIEIGCVRPSAWEGFCRRRTSWYLDSGKMGEVLIVCSYPLETSGLEDPILIRESTFKPARLPTLGEIAGLLQSVSFQRRKPRIWDKIDPIEKEFQKRWSERHGLNDSFDFETTFLTQSANHSNFITPEFYIDVNGIRVPYSIADSAHVCSSCIEFFNILGEQWPVKYVVPCIGAVQFAHLSRDRYFEVVSRNTCMDHKKLVQLENRRT